MTRENYIRVWLERDINVFNLYSKFRQLNDFNQATAGIVNKCNDVLVVMRDKISVLETYRDVRYAYKILERDKNASGYRQLGRGKLMRRISSGWVTLYFARLLAFIWPLLLQIVDVDIACKPSPDQPNCSYFLRKVLSKNKVLFFNHIIIRNAYLIIL